MTNPDPAPDKAAMRSRYRRLLRDMPAPTRTTCSQQIVAVLSDWLQARPGIRNLAVFAALPGEPDLRSLHEASAQTFLLYPLVGGQHRLSFHRVDDPGTLVVGSFGIREPAMHLHEEVPVGDIDAFVCPGIAFDETGARLGRGGGFYDRVLEGARPDAVRIGACFALQVAPAVPREPHDIVMMHLATEDGVRGVRPNPECSS